MSDSDSKEQRQHLDSVSANEDISGRMCVSLFSTESQFAQSVRVLLDDERYELNVFSQLDKLLDFMTKNKGQIDCIVLINNSLLGSAFSQELRKREILLPTIIIETGESIKDLVGVEEPTSEASTDNTFCHQAEIHLYPTQLKEIDSYINLAITKFLKLAPDSEPNNLLERDKSNLEETAKSSLVVQQRRLTNKIKERLGYLGVYYKRNSCDFYRNLSEQNREKLLNRLSNCYRRILLNYFDDNQSINQLIDEFVDLIFFADVPTSQILEIHMNLIDEFSHQLQIEGRNDDILLDYRLPLIDVISHLCEMYRRSIPGEDISLELLFGVK